jgi:hypothetical protein
MFRISYRGAVWAADYVTRSDGTAYAYQIYGYPATGGRAYHHVPIHEAEIVTETPPTSPPTLDIRFNRVVLSDDCTGNRYAAIYFDFAPPQAESWQLNFFTANGTAIAGLDYSSVSGAKAIAREQAGDVVVIPLLPGSTGKTVRLNLAPSIAVPAVTLTVTLP